ncbi:MAG: bifunctional nuclease family protein [Deltaproteobacteria bacterium]|nr:bifunctional nuclease family protein [Deltaproteobacteria bacterium]
MATEVQVFGVILEEETKNPVVVLRAVEGDETLPIQVGFAEAAAIAAVVEKVDVPRPMTHDLLVAMTDALGGRVLRVEITDLREATFFAAITLKRGARTFTIDARPSDAIAVALRTRASIYVSDDVFRKLEPSDLTEASRQQWLGFLHALEAAGELEGAKEEQADEAKKDLVM